MHRVRQPLLHEQVYFAAEALGQKHQERDKLGRVEKPATDYQRLTSLVEVRSFLKRLVASSRRSLFSGKAAHMARYPACLCQNRAWLITSRQWKAAQPMSAPCARDKVLRHFQKIPLKESSLVGRPPPCV